MMNSYERLIKIIEENRENEKLLNKLYAYTLGYTDRQVELQAKVGTR